MIQSLMLMIIAVPISVGVILALFPKRVMNGKIVGAIAFAISVLSLFGAVAMYGKTGVLFAEWAGSGIDFALRLYSFSGFIVLAASFFVFIVALYGLAYLSDKPYAKNFQAYFLIAAGFSNGAVLADNLIVLLFFWEGLLLSIFGMIGSGGKQSFRTAFKFFVLVGISDLCLMLGIGATGMVAGTFSMTQLHVAAGGVGALAFVLMVIGAIGKAGALPFHTWIPDAAEEAPLPFMAFMPAALEKLLGIYLLTRICVDWFDVLPGSALSTGLMSLGAVTILVAVMMALVQKNYNRLLAYHAVSQVGYMILGIGTGSVVGIVGGLFHMINNAIYKSGLFLSGGAVERQTGSAGLEKLGGLRKRMPVTFACFAVCALSISGVPPFNGFFSKELLYDAALEQHRIFYLAAVVGSFFTAISFLKLGHAAYCGKLLPENEKVREAPLAMLIPMAGLSLLCVALGLFNHLPVHRFLVPVLGVDKAHGHHLSGMPGNYWLVAITLIVLAGAFAEHWFAAKLKGGGLKAADLICHAPGLHQIYELAKKKVFDPYEIGMGLARIVAKGLWGLDRTIDWFYDVLCVKTACGVSLVIRRLHAGSYAIYILWTLIGAFGVVYWMMR